MSPAEFRFYMALRKDKPIEPATKHQGRKHRSNKTRTITTVEES